MAGGITVAGQRRIHTGFAVLSAIPGNPRDTRSLLHRRAGRSESDPKWQQTVSVLSPRTCCGSGSAVAGEKRGGAGPAQAQGPALATAMNPCCRSSRRMATALNRCCSHSNSRGSTLSCLRAPVRPVSGVDANGGPPCHCPGGWSHHCIGSDFGHRNDHGSNLGEVRYCVGGNNSGLEPARSGLQGIDGSCWVVTSRPAEITEQYATTCGSPKLTLHRMTGCPW